MSVQKSVLWVVALLAVVVSGIQVAYSTSEVRELHAKLQEARHIQDDELAEHSRLLLERATLAAYQNVERMAQVELGMQFPKQVERVEP